MTLRRPKPQAAFTLVELLVAIAVVVLLAAIVTPALARAKEKAKQAACLANLRQVGAAFAQYLADFDGILPDRRDLKLTLPGGYRPWTTWPPSDPRCAWAAVVLDEYVRDHRIWSCDAAAARFHRVVQVMQIIPGGTSTGSSYWMWRFDRPDEPVPLDNLWGKSEDGAVQDLQDAGNPQIGFPHGVADVELAVDPYFPATIPSVPVELKGQSVHFGGRNRLFLDGHVKFLRDIRTF
jgi:prepilin-type N-terminal cleavage/methylation domain-containing protein/prepilin-type processing-associated H-X9-DG protein